MSTSFVIENFKKFKKLDIKNLARFNMFLGNNNSGKSTVLEAIGLSANSDFYNSLLKALRINNNISNARIRSMPLRFKFDLSSSVEDYLTCLKAY